MFSFFSRKSVVSTPAASTRKASHKGMKVPTSTLATQYTAAQWATMGPGEKSGATKRATAAGYMSAVIGGSAAKQSAPSVTVSAPKQSASKNVKASAPRTASSTLPSQYTPAEWAKLGPGEKSGATKRATAAGFASAVYDPKGDISAKTVRAAISAKSLAKNGATVQDVIEQARRDDQGTDEPVVSPQAKAAQTRKARKAKSSAINADAPTGTQSSAVRDAALGRKPSVQDEIPNGTVQTATFDSPCPACSSPMIKNSAIVKVAGRFQHVECPATSNLATQLKGQALCFRSITSFAPSKIVDALGDDLQSLHDMLEATLELGLEAQQALADALTLQRNTSAQASKPSRKSKAA